MSEKKYNASKESALLGMVLGLAVGFDIGLMLNKDYSFKPDKVYVKDLNGDKRPDVVIKLGNGEKMIYLQQENGYYQKLEQVQKQTMNSLEKKVKDL